MLIWGRFIQIIFLSLFIGGLYYQFDGSYTDDLNWRALTGFFFFNAVNTMMFGLVPVELVFPIERGVFLKEEGSKLYSTFTYFLSRNIIEIPYSIMFPFVELLILYWFVNLSSTVEQFFICYLVAYLIFINGVSLGLLLGSVYTDAKSTSALTPLVIIPFLIFAGYFKNRENIPSWISWFEYISPIKYTFSAWITN